MANLSGKHVQSRDSFSITEVQSKYGREVAFFKFIPKEKIRVRRYDDFFPIRQDEPYKEKQGNWKQAWPWLHQAEWVKTMCTISDKFVEDS